MHYNGEVTRAQRKEGVVLMGPSVLGILESKDGYTYSCKLRSRRSSFNVNIYWNIELKSNFLFCLIENKCNFYSERGAIPPNI